MERVGKVFGGDCRGGTVFGGSSVGATTPNIVPPSLDEKKRERQDSNRNVNVSHIHEHLLKTDDGSSKLFMEEYESQQAYNTNLRRAPDSYRSTDYGLSIPRDKPREITSCSFSSTNHKKNATREVSQFLDEAQQCEDQTKGSNRDFHLLQSPPRRPSSSGVLPGGSAVEKETEERNASINSKTLVGRLFAGERELRGRNLGSSDAESSAIAAKTQQHLGHKSCLLDEAYENKEGVSSSSLPNMFCTATRGTSGVLQEAAPIYDVGPRQSNIGSDGFLKRSIGCLMA